MYKTIICILLLVSIAAVTAHAQGPKAGPPAGRGAKGKGLNSQSLGNAHFEIDEDSKTLIVVTDEATNEALTKLLKQLDTPVPHASIKVLFLEVTYSNGSDMGIDMTHKDVENNGDETTISSLFGVAAGITKGGTVAVLQNDLDVTIKALAENNKLEVLSSPSIMARSNEEAEITIGEEVPFIRNSQITDAGQSINTIEYEDVGIILNVTPQVTDQGTVELQLETEISTMTGETVDISETVKAPTIAKRSAKTKVVVPDGKTVVIGGLMGSKETVAVTKIPILGSIPLLGRLFQRKTTTKVKTELLIFLTPHAVTGAKELEAYKNSTEDRTKLIKERFPDKSYLEYLNGNVEKPQKTEVKKD